jgi:hypothetical protein
MAQSKPHHFFARVSDSGEGLTGFACLAASTGIAAKVGDVFAGGGVSCAESTTKKRPVEITKANVSVCLDIRSLPMAYDYNPNEG